MKTAKRLAQLLFAEGLPLYRFLMPYVDSLQLKEEHPSEPYFDCRMILSAEEKQTELIHKGLIKFQEEQDIFSVTVCSSEQLSELASLLRVALKENGCRRSVPKRTEGAVYCDWQLDALTLCERGYYDLQLRESAASCLSVEEILSRLIVTHGGTVLQSGNLHFRFFLPGEMVEEFSKKFRQEISEKIEGKYGKLPMRFRTYGAKNCG